MENLAAIENVVRVIFPSTMMNEGELLPAAFKLRQQKDAPEQYISVFRQYSDSFHADILRFDKLRNLPCCILNVGEVDAITLKIANSDVKYFVRAVPTETSLSHAGIFIYLGGVLIEGNGNGAFSALGLGVIS